MEVKAPAKVNWHLAVGGRRSDGYHPILSVFQTCSICDVLDIVPEDTPGREEALQLLRELLDEDFPRFDLNAEWIGRYTGADPQGPSAKCFRRGSAPEEVHPMGGNTSWSASYDEKYLYLTIRGVRGTDLTVVVEPCRLWVPFRLDFRNGEKIVYSSLYRENPAYVDRWDGDDLHLSVPLDLFEGIRHPGFPVRMNIFSPGRFHWVDPQPWPARLQHGDFNPAGCGWLTFA